MLDTAAKEGGYGVSNYDKLIFELSREGRKAYSLPKCDVDTLPVDELIPKSIWGLHL